MSLSTPDVAERVRDAQREEWAAAAPGWRARSDEVSMPTRSITDRMIELAQLEPGHRVLDLACGAGDPALRIAEEVGAEGSVLGLDISDPMVASARELAVEREIINVEFRVIPSELELDVEPATFDRATCRAGLMYMPAPAAALAAVREALRPGGRCVAGSWGPPVRMPAMAIPMEIISRYVDLPAPDPGDPSPFAIPTEEGLAGYFRAAGFSDVETITFETPVIEADTPAAYWDLLAEIGGPIVILLRSLPGETARAIRDDAIQTLDAMFAGDRVCLGGEHILAVGTNPA